MYCSTDLLNFPNVLYYDKNLASLVLRPVVELDLKPERH
jgi:hypothetical protein